MTPNTLRELLDELGSDHPPVRIDPATYRRGRRAHLRRLVVGGAAAALAVVALGSGLLPLLDRDVPGEPAGDVRSPALPSHISDVPARLAEVRGDDEGDTYRWHPRVAAAGLDVGTTAAVLPVNGGAVMAVSAEDGAYRGLELPGFDEDAYLRFGDLPVALSPDGNRLAYTWNPHVIAATTLAEYEPSGVRIVDLTTGRVDSVRIGGGYGVYAHAFGWSHDGRYLVYDLDVTSDGTGRVDTSRTERLDTTSGRRVRVRGLPMSETGPAVSDRGEVAVVGNGPSATWDPRRRPAVVRLDGGGGEWTAAWSPDGSRIAAGSWDRGWFSVGSTDRDGLVAGTAADAPPGSQVRVVGWAGADEVALLHRAEDDSLVVSAVPVGDPPGGDGRLLVEVDAPLQLTQLSLATALLERPARTFPEPDWPADPARVVVWSVVGGSALVLGGWWLLRRRPVGPGSRRTGR